MTRAQSAGDRLADYDFDLPEELIAQTPAERRDDSRLLMLDRASGAMSHHRMRSLAELLRAGDLLVFNDVRVRRARIRGRSASGGKIELLLLRQVDSELWECLGRPGKRLRNGAEVELAGGAACEIVASDGERRRVRLRGVDDVEAYLEQHGEVPLPPYIKRPQGPVAADADRYQTVFADRVGAVAAPTAGLHFSPELLAALGAAGVATARVTLEVGPATFLPVRVDALDECNLEAERASVGAEAVEAIAATKAGGGRVIAVGTTTTRTLESRAAAGGLRPGEFAADAFIRPGFRFSVIDGLLTNFHLPRSTLLVLVSAFAGRQRMLRLYEEAVRQRYRFYSYGDATLLV